MRYANIRELIEKTNEIDPVSLGSEYFTYVDIASIDREVKRITEPQRLLVSEAPSRARKHIHANDVLVSTVRPNLNAVALVPSEHHDQIASTGFCVLRANTVDLLPEYLFYFTQTGGFIDHLTTIATGASYPAVTDDDILDSVIPLPSLVEQRRIAAILRAADDERRRRRYTQTLSDGLLGEVFVRMFGDPATNPMGWEVCTIDEVLSETQYGTSEKSNQEGRGYPILGMGNITYDGRVDLSSLAYIEMSHSEFQKLQLRSGDVIFNRTNSTELVGKTACWRHEMDAVLASYLVKLTLLPTVVPEYFVAVLNTSFFKGQFRERCKKAIGQSNISPTLLSEFSIAVPPPDLQREFAGIAEAHEAVRRQQEESARQSDHLFDTLLHRAFAGEL